MTPEDISTIANRVEIAIRPYVRRLVQAEVAELRQIIRDGFSDLYKKGIIDEIEKQIEKKLVVDIRARIREE